jgi:kumamolisin
MPTIEISQVRALAPKPLDQYSKAFSATDVATILDKYGISDSPLRVCHFMAQILTETGRLRVLVEDLDYSASRLMAVWPSRFPTIEIAEQYAHDEEKLGNFVYANRMDNGNTASGDGYKYRGRGLLQITGKNAYTRFGKQLGIPLATDPDLAFDPEHCLAIAAAEWAVSGYHNQSCNELADKDDIYGVTHAINGGLTGIDDRIAWLKRCKAVWLPAPALASRAVAREDDRTTGQQDMGSVQSYAKRPVARQPSEQAACAPYFKRPGRTLSARIPGNAGPWDIGDLCKTYSWPTNQPGGGVIAIVELDGGYTPKDMTAFFKRIGRPNPSLTDIFIDGAKNNPNLHIGEDGDPDIEVTMDIQVAAAAYSIATGKAANIRVYWAPNQPGAIAKAVRQATTDGCDTCSISWGADEGIWKGWATSDQDFIEDMEDAAKAASSAKMIVFAAAGDNDSSDGGSNPANVDVPSSCPSVVGCGGTTKTRSSETVWNNDPGQSNGQGTGGGYSDYFGPPAWQAKAPQIGQDPPRRMVPDVAGNADPNTGYNLTVHGKYTNYGGTSAVAPLYAGLFAAFGRKLGPISPTIWDHADCFTDIVSGENGEYPASVGPDPCTGLGVPIGTKLAALFANFASTEAKPALVMPPASGFVPAPFNAAQATQYGLFVDAAYSMYEANPNNLTPEPTADFPTGYKLVAWILMRDFIVSQTNQTFYGFIAQSATDSNRFVMAIRGTQTPEEWWDDFTSLLKTPFSVPDCGEVALGFNRIYQSIEIIERPSGTPGASVAPRSLQSSGTFSQQAASLVKRLSEAATARVAGVPASASVTVVGHSLGSALATLYTLENARGDKIQNPTICTFASPRVGDGAFVSAFSALPLTSWRIVNAPDVVPMLPPEIAGFSHVGVQTTFDSSKTTQASIGCWHAMATYLSLLDPARQPDSECRIGSIAPGAAVARAGLLAPRSATSTLLTQDVITAAQASQQKWGIPASITIAQWALESGWGKHMPPDSNNPFGIKAVDGQPFVEVPTHEYINGQMVVVQAKFRKFGSLAEAFDAHDQLLATSPYYAAARSFENDPTKFANALTGVYATDPNYGTLLNNIISGSNLMQYDLPFNPGSLASSKVTAGFLQARNIGGAGDGSAIASLLKIASDPSQLQDAQAQAAKLLLAYDGEQYPSDGCAITLSVLLQVAGIDVADTFQAIILGKLLIGRGWTQIAIGDQVAGDVGSTCGPTAHHGTDHIYLVLKAANSDEMVVADNQEPTPHFRFASGQGKSPTRFFLRAPKSGA